MVQRALIVEEQRDVGDARVDRQHGRRQDDRTQPADARARAG
jgi:hypothetical protein